MGELAPEQGNPWGKDETPEGVDPFSDAAVMPRVQTRPRDEQGRFATQQPQEEPAEEPQEEAGEEAPPELIGGRFKSVDDLVRSYEALERKLGETAPEREELRQMRAQLEGMRQRMEAPAPQQITQQMLEENPGYATQLAWEQGDMQGVQRAFALWHEEDPATAYMWWSDMLSAQRVAELERRFEERFKPLQQDATTATVSRALAAVRSRFSDFDAYSGSFEEIGNRAPEIVAAMRSGNQQHVERALENLYYMARGRNADNLLAANQAAATQQAQDAQQERLNAQVATAQAQQTRQTSSSPDWKKQIQESILRPEWEDEQDVPAFARGNVA